ncbi:MAG: DUF177 domain-containing protein [Desulfobacterales bacterium]
MRVNVDDINENGIELAFREDAASFPALAELGRRREGDFTMPLTIELHIRRIGDLFAADGRFATRVRQSCSRCLADFEAPLAADFSLTFTRQPAETPELARRTEIELDPEEIGQIFFRGDEIDLAAAVQEEVLMALPMTPRCRPDCKGLCPRCGADLNPGDCGCDRKVVNPKFAVLSSLKLAKK